MSHVMESSSRRSPGSFAGIYQRNVLLDFLWRFLLIYLFLSNWVWFNELAVNPTRPIRPVFSSTFGNLAWWMGYHVFHLTGPLTPNSFRDTRYLYLLLLVLAIISAVVAGIWIAFGRNSRSVQTAYILLRIWLRYTLAYMILIYAMDKIFRLQFPFPGLLRLIEPYGDSSPMALLWTYVGYSPVLTIFSGLLEAAGAVLLLWRRTTPLGALISVVMMANVALMDFCYDVSVKLLAAHFLGMSVFLLAHDAKRLLAVLAWNDAAPAQNLEKEALPISNVRVGRFLPIVKALIVLYTIAPCVWRTWKQFREAGPFAARAPFYGLYQVTSFSINGSDHPLLVNDNAVWRYVIIEHPSEVTIKRMDNNLIVCKAKYETRSPHLELRGSNPVFGDAASGNPAFWSPGSAQINLSLSPSEHGEMMLSGEAGRDHVSALLLPINPQNFTLVSRGFHWINEKSSSK